MRIHANARFICEARRPSISSWMILAAAIYIYAAIAPPLCAEESTSTETAPAAQREAGEEPFQFQVLSSQRFQDSELARLVRNALTIDPLVSPYDVQVVVENRVATLTGDVPTEIIRSQAENIATAISGLRGVLNHIEIQDQVLFRGDRRWRITGFGGPVVRGSFVNEETSLILGGRAGLLFNRTVSIGGGAYGMVHDVEGAPDLGGNAFRLVYTGAEFEFIATPYRLVHSTAYLLLGGGWLSLKADDGLADDSFLIAEPVINLELNLTPFLRANVGLGYRFIEGTNTAVYSDWDISGPFVQTSLKLGRF